MASPPSKGRSVFFFLWYIAPSTPSPTLRHQSVKKLSSHTFDISEYVMDIAKKEVHLLSIFLNHFPVITYLFRVSYQRLERSVLGLRSITPVTLELRTWASRWLLQCWVLAPLWRLMECSHESFLA
jgi:hypothetical protein